ncbi:MAG: hypothetical protein INR69_17250 [Mucilaginibacter polytrichastri]|nr:hypothetical protein [Mucilaginibacter polytrichastri]
MSQVYFILEDLQKNGGTHIISRDSHLHVRVYTGRRARRFMPNPDELQMYGLDGDELIAFETQNIVPEDAIDMIDAIHYYARYTRNSDMEILAEPPGQKQAPAF